jgi:hypothetical protein
VSDRTLLDARPSGSLRVPVLGRAAVQVTDSPSGARLPSVIEPPLPDDLPRLLVEAANRSFFHIRYADCAGRERVFKFSLLPAIESNLRYSSTSRLSAGGGATVPEVKPGLLKRTTLNVKRFNVPGGPPAIQVLGTEQTLWQLVGALIGNEVRDEERGRRAQELYPAWPSDEDPKLLNASWVAHYFDEQVVQTGRSVEVHIYSHSRGGSDLGDRNLEIRFRAVMQSARYFVTRQDRVYYAFDFWVTEYKQCFRAASDSALVPAPPTLNPIPRPPTTTTPAVQPKPVTTVHPEHGPSTTTAPISPLPDLSAVPPEPVTIVHPEHGPLTGYGVRLPSGIVGMPPLVPNGAPTPAPLPPWMPTPPLMPPAPMPPPMLTPMPTPTPRPLPGPSRPRPRPWRKEDQVPSPLPGSSQPRPQRSPAPELEFTRPLPGSSRQAENAVESTTVVSSERGPLAGYTLHSPTPTPTPTPTDPPLRPRPLSPELRPL